MARSNSYKDRARQLREAAESERRKDRRRHMLDLAETYERAADEAAPPPKPVGKWSRS
jgi:hypothetical protein